MKLLHKGWGGEDVVPLVAPGPTLVATSGHCETCPFVGIISKKTREDPPQFALNPPVHYE